MCCSLKNCLVYVDDKAGSSSEYTVIGLPPILLKPSIKPDSKLPSVLVLSGISSVYFDGSHIRFLASRAPAAIAERQIKATKAMLHKRIENSEKKDWEDHTGYVLLAYNHKMVNRSKGMTPYEARADKNLLNVTQHVELHAKHDRLYPDINVGDKVKLYTKKKILSLIHI